MPTELDISASEQVFTAAHTANKFSDRPVSNEMLHTLYDFCKWGLTSMNCQPMRLLFVRSHEAKVRLWDALMLGNVDKTMAAPVTVIVAMDTAFHELMPAQFPTMPTAGQMFAANLELARDTALRNSSLQGGNLILAARMLGLATGPMSGFDSAKVDAEFFPDGRWKVNFLVNLGVADPTGYRPRGSRLGIDEISRFE
jgi:3-hydroxypropanoate dehydrogenase